MDGIDEAEVREALQRLDPLWDELFPAEQARIVQLLVERVDVSPDGADIRCTERLTNLVADLRAVDQSKGRRDGGTSVARDGRHCHRASAYFDPQARWAKARPAPDGAKVNAAPIIRRIDNAMVKAIARAFRWRDMLEAGEYATIREIAAAEKINETYVGRMLRMTLLAPDIVEAILNGRQPTGLQLDGLMSARAFVCTFRRPLAALLLRAATLPLIQQFLK